MNEAGRWSRAGAALVSLLAATDPSAVNAQDFKTPGKRTQTEQGAPAPEDHHGMAGPRAPRTQEDFGELGLSPEEMLEAEHNAPGLADRWLKRFRANREEMRREADRKHKQFLRRMPDPKEREEVISPWQTWEALSSAFDAIERSMAEYLDALKKFRSSKSEVDRQALDAAKQKFLDDFNSTDALQFDFNSLFESEEMGIDPKPVPRRKRHEGS